MLTRGKLDAVPGQTGENLSDIDRKLAQALQIFRINPNWKNMDENYDSFSYLNEDERMYEPILDQSLDPNAPPIPPRNPRLPPVPTKFKPAIESSVPPVPTKSFTLPQRNARLPPVPTLSNLPKVPWRSKSPLPDVTQRAPLPIPDDTPQYPQIDYEVLNIDDDHPQLDYEELNPCDQKGPPAPIPDKMPIPVSDNSQFDNSLNAARRNLKKTGLQSQNESPRPQLPVRSELPAKPQISPVKPTLPKKPQVATKPRNITFAKEKSPNLTEKINALNLDTTDRRPIQTPVKISSHNSFKKTNPIQTPGKLTPHNSFKKTKPEDDPQDDFDIPEYADAADVDSLHFQPYYYEKLDKTLENKIFNENTEDGTFVVRKSRGDTHPYTMLVYFESRPFRLKIRFEGDTYAIGEKKADEIQFPTVIQMVNHYMRNPLILIGAGSTKLKMPPDDF